MSVAIFSNLAILSYTIQKDPGMIVGPISKFLGVIVNFIFNIVYTLTVNHSLGLSIILLTIVTRILMLPLAVKQQQSMVAMQRLQPEMDKIKSKYPNSKDPEVQQKMNAEIQSLYAKHKVNPLSGCLPLLVTMPIFFALNYIMNQSYMFITKLGDLYRSIAVSIMEIPGYVSVIRPMIVPKVAKGLELDLRVVDDVQKALNKFSYADWNALFEKLPAEVLGPIKLAFQDKISIETFIGITLIDSSGLQFPGILIPILCGLTTFLSSYLMNKTQKAADSNAQMQQKVMLIFMPIMMGVMTINMSAGVGLYWITSSVFQIVQQYVLNKRLTR